LLVGAVPLGDAGAHLGVGVGDLRLLRARQRGVGARAAGAVADARVTGQGGVDLRVGPWVRGRAAAATTSATLAYGLPATISSTQRSTSAHALTSAAASSAPTVLKSFSCIAASSSWRPHGRTPITSP